MLFLLDWLLTKGLPMVMTAGLLYYICVVIVDKIEGQSPQRCLAAAILPLVLLTFIYLEGKATNDLLPSIFDKATSNMQIAMWGIGLGSACYAVCKIADSINSTFTDVALCFMLSSIGCSLIYFWLVAPSGYGGYFLLGNASSILVLVMLFGGIDD